MAICSTWTSLVAAVLPDCVSSGPSIFFFFEVGLVSTSSSRSCGLFRDEISVRLV